MGHDLIRGGEAILIVLVMAGAVPELAAAWQFLLVAGHFRRNHYAACEPAFPRTANLSRPRRSARSHPRYSSGRSARRFAPRQAWASRRRR